MNQLGLSSDGAAIARFFDENPFPSAGISKSVWSSGKKYMLKYARNLPAGVSVA